MVRLVHEPGEPVELPHRARHPPRRAPAAVVRQVDGHQRLDDRLLQLVHPLRQRVLQLPRRPLQRAHRRLLRLRHWLRRRRQEPEQLRRPEPADPEEEPLGRAPPRAGEHGEGVPPGRGGPGTEQRVVVGQPGVDEGAQLDLRRVVRLQQRRPELAGVPALLLRPPRVLRLERCGGWVDGGWLDHRLLPPGAGELLLQLRQLHPARL
uniref:Uncharacterized protein n=1 Tax=Arundo donax TaxID=35708 RepID=A0A0A8XVD6_ARUDO